MQFAGILDFLKEYQAKSGEAGVDPLGWYLPPFAYAYLQILGDAVEGAKTLDNAKLADYMHSHPFKTIVGDISFGPDGEWTKPRVLEVQWQGVKSGNVDDFKDTKNEVILEPSEYKTGTVVAPYTDAQK
jgi:branched-chain amino acid transport system substrate-binding protein